MLKQACKIKRFGCLAILCLIPFVPDISTGDDLNCDYTLCDKANPCNRGCKCTYPQGASVGYCTPWYQSKSAAGVAATELAAKKYRCSCDDPCSGSITCSTGCYAFCEENPENSGRFVCVKGCASANLDQVPANRFSTATTFSTVSLHGPAYAVLPVLKKLFGSQPIEAHQAKKSSMALTTEADATRNIDLNLTKSDLAGILDKIH